MRAKILFSAHKKHFDAWSRILPDQLADRGVDAELMFGDCDPSQVDYIAYAPHGKLFDFTPFTRLKAVLSLWAGIEELVKNDTINCPITRMVDSGMIEGMTEWVTAQVLRHHLGIDRIINGQDGVWAQSFDAAARIKPHRGDSWPW